MLPVDDDGLPVEDDEALKLAIAVTVLGLGQVFFFERAEGARTDLSTAIREWHSRYSAVGRLHSLGDPNAPAFMNVLNPDSPLASGDFVELKNFLDDPANVSTGQELDEAKWPNAEIW